MSSAELTEAVEPRKKNNVKYASICAILASMASVILGYDIGVMSGAAMYIKKDLKITDVQLEILIGIISVYSLIGSFAGARRSDRIGRRWTVVFAAVIFFVDALLMGFAVNYGMLMVGRFVAGVGVGYMVGRFVACSWYGRARVHRRDLAGGIPRLHHVLPGSVHQHRYPARLCVELRVRSPPAPQRLADIKVAAGIPKDLDGDVVTVPKERNGGEMQVWKELIFSPTPAIRRILLSGVGVHFFQQASGLDSIVLYSPSVFKSAGITGDNKLLGVTCAVGVTKTLFILVAMFLLDRVGRRPLLLTSAGGTIISLICLGTGLTVVGHHPDAKIPTGVALCIASTLAYVAFFSYHGRVQLGDIPAAGAGAGLRGWRGVQPLLQLRYLHDLPVPLEGYHHRRQLLPLLRHRHSRVGVLHHVPSGDPRSYAGGDGQAVRHGRHGHG